jgi:phenylacetate-coenzyme A ligase PaaK-like adenylate-forming protein
MQQTGNINPPGISDVEYLPFHQLLSIVDNKIAGVIARGFPIALYKKKWLSSGIKQNSNFKLSDLKRFPFLTQSDLIDNSRDSSPKKYAGRHIQFWNSADIESPAPCWLPRGKDDVADYMRYALRIAHVLELREDDRILVLSQAASGATNMLPYALAHVLKAEQVRSQIITMDMGILRHTKKWVEFLNRNRPKVMIAQGKDALELTQMLIGGNSDQSPSASSPPDGSLKPMPDLRLILLYGPDAAIQQTSVYSTYQADTHLSLGLVDLNLFGMECSARQGIHLWLDTGIYEIIPQNEIAKEQTQQGYVPGSNWLWETEAGIQGELVITNFSEILPLIRYRTGYLVEALGHETCRCGRTHPRVRLL